MRDRMPQILSALARLDCAEMSHNDWIRVGMALKAEGFEESVWEAWSALDTARYRPGECARRWESFQGCEQPVTGGTIIKMARERGWKPPLREDGCLDWNAEIDLREGAEGGGNGKRKGGRAGRKPTEELIAYLETLFRPEEKVSYVTGDAWQGEDGRWSPGRGVFHRTAGELIGSLKQYPDDIGATVGDWKEEAGAWIRFNPMDGKGVKNVNVTAFRFALVESDTMPMEEQVVMYRKMELPIAALVSSGGKSIHAIVRIDAENAEEYRERVAFLYDWLAARGLQVDVQNRNPSRMSRMPGVTRNGREQKLLAVNIGRKSWADWIDFAEGLADDLPELTELSRYASALPAQPEELIRGVLRRGHKMLISGSSKAGKSFLLIELCIAIAEGKQWLGFDCRKGRVLYVNLEIDPASCIHRFYKIYNALGMEPKHMSDILIWNLRGYAAPLNLLVPKLVRRARNRELDAIVIDPIYKVITGDENNATDMAAFCNQFDRICMETGCSVVYCHHHSKGAQGAKRAMDRASGSGVFARDPDAQLDMIELEMSEEMQDLLADNGATGWRLECSLREFRNFQPVNFWFEYPIHRVDRDAVLQKAEAQGAAYNRIRERNRQMSRTAEDEFRTAFDTQKTEDSVSVRDMVSFLGVNDKTVYARIRKMKDEFTLRDGRIYRQETLPS